MDEAPDSEPQQWDKNLPECNAVIHFIELFIHSKGQQLFCSLIAFSSLWGQVQVQVQVTGSELFIQ